MAIWMYGNLLLKLKKMNEINFTFFSFEGTLTSLKD